MDDQYDEGCVQPVSGGGRLKAPEKLRVTDRISRQGVVRRRDLDGGGLRSAEAHGLRGAASELAELGSLHACDLVRDVVAYLLRQSGIVECEQGATTLWAASTTGS